MQLSHQFFKRYSNQTSELWEDILSLRLSVFVDEMNVPVELEVDEFDEEAIHLRAQTGKKTVGTLRLVLMEEQASHCYVKLGRVAVHPEWRRKGIGKQMMQLAINHCKELHCSKISLGSQTYITSFYESLGFATQGDVFDDAGIPHIAMYLDIK
ncbi:MAG: GNAT family N-acetyltransferase [Thiotrichaceae bacterium]